MKKSSKKIKNDKLYDSVFWTEANLLTQYLPMLVNEAFGEHFTQNAKVTLLPGKETVENKRGSISRREADSFFVLSETLDEYVEKKYHFECEVRGKRTIAIRIAEYAAGYAFENVIPFENGALIEIPNSAVIFLRSDSADIKQLRIKIRYPAGEVGYDVPVLRIKDYSLKELFEKRLLLLVPFYAFIYSDNEYAIMDQNDGDASRIEEMLNEINQNLEQMVTAGELENWQKENIIRYTGMVLEKLVINYEQVGKEVKKIMGGYIIKTDIDIAREEGITKGIEKGIEKGKITEFISIRKEDGYSDVSIIDNLVKRFSMTFETAKQALADFMEGSEIKVL